MDDLRRAYPSQQLRWESDFQFRLQDAPERARTNSASSEFQAAGVEYLYV